MPEFTVQAVKTLPAPFRPSEDREMPELRDVVVVVRGKLAVILGAFRHPRRGVMCFVRVGDSSGWFSFDDLELF